MSAALEFVLRLKDEASAKIAAVRAAVRGTGKDSSIAAPDVAGLGKSITETATGFAKAREQMMKVVGVGGLVVGTFKASYEMAKPLGEYIRRMWDPVAQAAHDWPKLEEAMKRTADWLKGQSEEEKQRITGVNKVYDDQSAAIEKAANARRALASAKSTSLTPDEAAAEVGGANAGRANSANRRVEMEAMLREAQAAKASLADKLEQADKKAAETVLKDVWLAGDDGGGTWTKENVKVQPQEKSNQIRKNILAADKLADEKIALAEAALAEAKMQDADAESSYAVAVATLKTAQENEKKAKADAAKEIADKEKAAMKERLAEERQLKIYAVRDAAAAEREAQDAMGTRLEKAKDAAAQAWDEYRDPTKRAARVAGEQANAEAEAAYKKEAAALEKKLSRYGDRAQLTDAEKSVQAVTEARREQAQAADALKAIETNTRGLGAKLEALLRMK